MLSKVRNFRLYLTNYSLHYCRPVEVEEPLGAVDVVEGGEAGDGAVDAHGVRAQLAARRQQQPVRVRAAQEHAVVPKAKGSCDYYRTAFDSESIKSNCLW